MTLPGETEATVAVYRIPLTENRAYGLARALSEHPKHELRVEGQFLLVDAPRAAKWTAVRLGDRAAHALAGRTTSGRALTLCGRALDPADSRYAELPDVTEVPLHMHCLRCWG